MSNVKPVPNRPPQPQNRLQKSQPTRSVEPATAAAPQIMRRGYVVLLAIGLVVLGVSTALAASRKLSGWEHALFVHINGMSLPHWVASQVAKPISDAVWGILGLIIILLAIPKYRLLAWQYLVAGGSTFVFISIIERLIDRGRPVALTHDVVLRAVQGGPGFPSGHVAVLTALCATLWPFVAWPWRILLAVLVAAEAWSRLYLGVHAPLDVIGGLAAAMVVVGVLHLAPASWRRIFRLQ